jgi:putative intracellular protease/amidase
MPATTLPTKIGVIIFPGFQLLDWAGPLDALNILSHTHSLYLCTIAATLDRIRTQNHIQSAQGSAFSQSLVPTHTFANAPRDLDVLLIPGGLGSRGEGSEVYMEQQVEYLKALDLSGRGSIKVSTLWLCEGRCVLTHR